VGKIAKKQPEGVRFLLMRHSKYSAMLSHSYRLHFRRFCPLGMNEHKYNIVEHTWQKVYLYNLPACWLLVRSTEVDVKDPDIAPVE